MKTFSNSANKIKITFICDACGVDTTVDSANVPASGETTITAVCTVCYKEFSVKIGRDANKSWVEIPGIADNNINITAI